MKYFFIPRLLLLNCIFIGFIQLEATAQSESSFEQPYNAMSSELPAWVKLMYSDNPNIKAVKKEYDDYYKIHPFEKNTYTQYYKRWIRDKWEFMDSKGYLVYPSKEEREKHMNEYRSLIQQNIKKNGAVANWEELGPWEYDHDATMDLSVQSPGASHVYTVEQSKSNPDVVYAGTARAGAWKSIDKGVSWELVTANYNILEVYSMEIDHTDSNIVYLHGNGKIWKTVDGGISWIETGSGQNFSWTRDIKMHPVNNQILLAATTSGLYRTDDGGVTWTPVLYGHYQEIEFHPTNPSIVYVIKQSANRTEFYKSIDSGLNFTLKSNGWPGIASASNTGNFVAHSFQNNSYANLSNVDLGSVNYPNFTIEMWVKSTGWNGDPSLISNKNWSSGSNKGFILAANGNGWKFNIGDGSSRIDINGGTLNDNLWHHIAVSYEANGAKKIYQDGVLIGTINNNISTSVESGLSLAIGQDGTLNYGFDFSGSIAEVRIWNEVISETEIKDWSCQQVDDTHPFYGSLLHLWKIDEGSGNVLIDSKGSNNGTINGVENWTSENEMVCVMSSLQEGEEQYRTEIAVSQDEPDHVYALSTGIADGGEGLFGFYKSTDAGESFTFICCGTGPGGIASTTNKNIVGYAYDLTSNGGQYYYDLGLGVSPTDSDRVMAAGISVIRSEDGGVNWETNGHWVTWVGENTKQRYTHADVHDVKFFKNGADVDMWVASDGGLYYSNDQGDNFEPRMHGIQGTEFWGFGASYNEDAMIGGTYHNGTLLHFEDEFLKGKNGKGGWFAGGAGDATKGYVHDADGRVMFQEGGMIKVFNREVYWKWLPFDNTKNANMIGSIGQYGNYEWDPYNYNVFYSPVNSILWKTLDNGMTWDAVHDFGSGSIYTLRIPVSNSNIIHVVHNDIPANRVRLWKTTDGGVSWSDITPDDVITGNNNYKNKIIEIDQDNPDNIWILIAGGGTGYKVFKSTDGGLSWSNITGINLNNEIVYDIAHHQGTDGGIYVGTKNAVYYRNNSHSDWQLFNNGLPLITRCNYLQPYYTEGKIRVGTYRGAYQSDFFEDVQPTVRISVNKTESDCDRDIFKFKDLSYVDHSNVSWSWTFENGTPATSNLENPEVSFPNGTHDVSLKVTNSYGSQTMTLDDFITVDSACLPDTIPGNVLSVSGNSASYARNSNVDELNFGDNINFTITTWIKTSTTSSDAVIIAKKDWDSGLNKGWVLSVNNGKLLCNIGDGSNRADLKPNVLINDGKWHHVAVTFDRASVMTIYIDGKNVGTANIAGIGNINNALETVVGADSEYDYPISAFIDETCIYNEALSQNEIREGRHLTKKSQTSNLVSYFQYNEVTGEVLDRIGTNHLVLSAGASRSSSSCPIGGGTSFRMDISSGGIKNFTGTGVTMAFPDSGTYPDGELVVSRINLVPDYEPGELQKDVYFVVNNYGSNDGFSTLEKIVFDEMGLISSENANSPSGFQLYRRNSNADGNTWGDIQDVADTVTSGSNGSITFSVDNNISEFSQFVITYGAPLPVEWLSFNAHLFEKDKVKLIWKIGLEENNEKYLIERSRDGIHFSEISEIQSLNLLEYSIIDSSPNKGSNYYRVKQLDFDGNYSYSKIRHVLVDALISDIVVFPNPVIQNSQIILKSILDEELEFVLFDSEGKKVLQTDVYKEGIISTKQLPSGSYIYRIISSNKITHGKLIVQ